MFVIAQYVYILAGSKGAQTPSDFQCVACSFFDLVRIIRPSCTQWRLILTFFLRAIMSTDHQCNVALMQEANYQSHPTRSLLPANLLGAIPPVAFQ